MNALVEHSIAAESNARDALATAQRLVERGDMAEAAAILADALATERLTAGERCDLQINLAAALSTLAQRDPASPASTEQLLRARDLLIQALLGATPGSLRWAVIRTNLAIVHMGRWLGSGSSHDLLEAHLALDGTEAVFAREQDLPGLDWSRAVRDHLTELKDRRAAPRTPDR